MELKTIFFNCRFHPLSFGMFLLLGFLLLLQSGLLLLLEGLRLLLDSHICILFNLLKPCLLLFDSFEPVLLLDDFSD